MNWHDLFSYDPDSGELRWKIHSNSRAPKGSLAGCLTGTKKNYLAVRYQKVRYYAHRVIWEMCNGPIPDGMHIDHINHITTDNRISNLRLVTQSENNKNLPLPCTNSSKVCGVNWHKLRGKWRAYIKVNNKDVHLGTFDSFDEAVAVRKAAEIKYGFHTNHGLAKELAA